MMNLITSIGMCMLIVATAVYGGAWLSIHLPEASTLFDRKPFNCRPCLTFHLCWTMFAAIAWMAKSAWWLTGGTGIAFVVFATVTYIDNKKVEK